MRTTGKKTEFIITSLTIGGFPGSSDGKESKYNARDLGLIPGSGRFPWRRDRLPTPVFLGFPGGLGFQGSNTLLALAGGFSVTKPLGKSLGSAALSLHLFFAQ